MTDTNQNLQLYRGDSVAVDIAITNADGSQWNPDAGVEAEWQLAKSSFSQALASKTIGDGLTVNATGVTLQLTAADTDQPAGLYYHELKVFDGDDVSTVMTGWVRIHSSMRMRLMMSPAAMQLSASLTNPNVSH